jgi:GT2 family glycosyltransferase
MEKVLGICTATMRVENDIGSWASHARYKGWTWTVRHNTPDDNWGILGSYQWLYEVNTNDLLMFIHDDVVCQDEGWDDRVRAEFEDEHVALCGFGGARLHGHPDLYKTPYRVDQLRRYAYVSNVDDAEAHGERVPTAMDVAVVDGFAFIVRRSFLDRIGGFHARCFGPCDYFCYDYILSALARRLGYRIRYIPIRCHHRGGQTSGAQGLNPEIFNASHRWFYENYRDVMPWSVNGRTR